MSEWRPQRVWARTLRAGQTAELRVIDVSSGDDRLVLESDTVLFESPTWHPDGRTIVVNADGMLFRVDVDSDAPALDRIPSDGLPELNNDHLISPDGRWHYVSANDGHLHRVPFEGGDPVRVTAEKEPERRFRHFLHGVSPDGGSLVFVGTEVQDGDEWGRRAIWRHDLTSGDESLVGDGFSPADGPEFTPDGRAVLFNSEIEARVPGHAQLFRIDLASGAVRRLTSDDRVDWFPHPSPDGMSVAYLSYPGGTEGHPADLDVVVRLIDVETGAQRDLVEVFGGQGTLNVPSWSPDSTCIAYVAYPLTAGGR